MVKQLVPDGDHQQSHPNQRGPEASTYKALCSIIHKTKLKSLLIFEAFCKSMPYVIGGKCFFSTVLKLCKYCLGINKYISQ